MTAKSGKSFVFKEVIYNDSIPRFIVFTVFEDKDSNPSLIGSIVFYFDSNNKVNYRSNVEFSELDSDKLAKTKSLAILIITS